MMDIAEKNMSISRIYLAHKYDLDKPFCNVYAGRRGSYGVIYGIEGEAKFLFSDGSDITLGKGEMMFVSPEAVYSAYMKDHFLHYTVNFELESDFQDDLLSGKLYFPFKSDNSEKYAYIMAEISEIWSAKEPAYYLKAMSLLYELFHLFALEREGHKNADPRAQRLDVAKKYIDKNWSSDICLSQLAALSNMSVTHFRREWKSRYGVTAIEYRDSLRLSHAKDLLESSFFTVAETAEKCGYLDVSYFIRFFKKKTGILPGAYRSGKRKI